MILVEIRSLGEEPSTIDVHPGVTVVGDLDRAARAAWAAELARALQGDPASSIEVDVEIDGDRRRLSPEFAAELGLADAAAFITIFAGDLPGAVAPSGSVAAEPDEPAPEVALRSDAEAEMATAESTLRRLGLELIEAERAATSIARELAAASRRRVDHDISELASAAETRLLSARAATGAARRRLAAAEAVVNAESDAMAAVASEARERLEELEAERRMLERERGRVVEQLAEAVDPGAAAAVEEALIGLRRLRSVRAKPSARAAAVADHWSEACERLVALPQPVQVPRWMINPALAALREARAAVVAAEGRAGGDAVDRAKLEALDRAHADVVEAEQRVMKKRSRINRRRLEVAHDAEQAVLASLGAQSYAEFVHRIAPTLENERVGGERLAAAQAALADAEQVWDELHGGEASPEWTAAKEQQASVRQEAFEVLGREVDDDEIGEALRSLVETVVDTGWAEEALAAALADAGADPGEGADIEQAAEQWLGELPARLQSRADLEAALGDFDHRLAGVDRQLATHDEVALEEGPEVETTPATAEPLAQLRRVAEDAAEAEREAEQALSAARERLAASEEQARARAMEIHGEVEARRNEVDRLRLALDEATAVLQRVREQVETERHRAPPMPATADDASTGAVVDLGGVVGMEAEAYLLARVAALRGAPVGPLPLVLDGAILTGLSEVAARRVYRLLGRLASSMQLVVLGDDSQISTWAEGLGDQAAVRSAAVR